MPTTLQTSVIGRISSLIEEINGVKTASDRGQTKRATELGLSGEGKQDPGGYQGKSDHPSARAASNVQKTPLGSRAKENETDVKHDHPGAGVDNVSEGSGGTQDDKQLNIGTNQSATGEDPSVEDDYKGTKEDSREGDRGGTQGPFNAHDIGTKYSNHRFADLTKVAYEKMNELLADVANGSAPMVGTKQASTQQRVAQQYGPGPTEAEKQAAAQAIIEQTILDARINADLVGEFLTKYTDKYAHLLKRSATDGQMGGAMEGEGGPPMDPSMDPSAGGGGPPPEMGGPPEGGGEGEGGGGGGLDEMINALLQMGMTPEDIEKALQAHMGGGDAGGGAPPGAGAGGPPPEMAGAGGGPPMGDMGKAGSHRRRGLNEEQLVMLKAAHMANQRFRTGNWHAKPVYTGTKEAQERTELQRYILEVCGFRS
jgi:hypothetical protein